MPPNSFEPWLTRWNLSPDGAPFSTPTGHLLPVRYRAGPALLKVVTEDEERNGSRVLAWWQGNGAAEVFERDQGAVLLERAVGRRSLAQMARGGHDRADHLATEILCDLAATLHAKDPSDRPDTTVPLEDWFRELWPLAASHGGVFAEAATTARTLLAGQREQVVLHGDLHHGNVLDFGAGRGWLAIDPKGLFGERTFDYVNLLRNPDAQRALVPGRFAVQVTLIAGLGGLDEERLLRWTVAFTGLSAAWIVGDGEEPALDLAIARLARAELAARS